MAAGGRGGQIGAKVQLRPKEDQRYEQNQQRQTAIVTGHHSV
jgi:hypothetical protein